MEYFNFNSNNSAEIIKTFNTGVNKMLQGNMVEAESILSTIVENNPTCRIAKRNLVYILLRLKHKERVREILSLFPSSS